MVNHKTLQKGRFSCRKLFCLNTLSRRTSDFSCKPQKRFFSRLVGLCHLLCAGDSIRFSHCSDLLLMSGSCNTFCEWQIIFLPACCMTLAFFYSRRHACTVFTIYMVKKKQRNKHLDDLNVLCVHRKNEGRGSIVGNTPFPLGSSLLLLLCSFGE